MARPQRTKEFKVYFLTVLQSVRYHIAVDIFDVRLKRLMIAEATLAPAARLENGRLSYLVWKPRKVFIGDGRF
ncbi:MAG TPA: hypothetical protein VHZ29_14310 [Rhizomicrobium sp.]|jgi:hypothetical protein|nr:hypothetical protein [Rhizomicrobium sp.]